MLCGYAHDVHPSRCCLLSHSFTFSSNLGITILALCDQDPGLRGKTTIYATTFWPNLRTTRLTTVRGLIRRILAFLHGSDSWGRLGFGLAGSPDVCVHLVHRPLCSSVVPNATGGKQYPSFTPHANCLGPQYSLCPLARTRYPHVSRPP